MNGKQEMERYKIESIRQLLSKYNGKRVVIIDDINDTGTTLKGIHDIVVMEGMTDNVKYVSLFEKLSSEFSVDIQKRKNWMKKKRNNG